MRSTILAYEWLSKCQSFIISSINHIHQDMSTESKGKYVFYNIQLSFTCHKLFLFVCITQTRGLYWLTMRNTSGELQGIGGSPLFPSIFIISIILIISGNQQRPRDTIYSLSTACMQRWRMRLLAHGTIVMSNVIFLGIWPQGLAFESSCSTNIRINITSYFHFLYYTTTRLVLSDVTWNQVNTGCWEFLGVLVPRMYFALYI